MTTRRGEGVGCEELRETAKNQFKIKPAFPMTMPYILNDPYCRIRFHVLLKDIQV